MARKAKLTFDPKVFLATVDGGRTKSSYRAGQIIFAQGGSSSSSRARSKSRWFPRKARKPSSRFLGPAISSVRRACADNRSASRPLLAMAESVVARVDKPTMLRTLRDEPEFSQLFTSYLLARTARIEEDLVDQLFNSSEKRLARALLILANVGKEGRPEPIIPKVDQATLAEMIGTTRARVSSFMNKFRQLGLIEYNGVLKIHTSLLDVVLHEPSPQIKRPK